MAKAISKKSRPSLGSAGYSLLELMVACAIVSILASVAIPNYKAFAIRAKCANGKSNLSSLYTAEKVFYIEYESYTTRLDAIGWSIEGIVPMNVGFDKDSRPPVNAPQGSSSCLTVCGDYYGANQCNALGKITCQASARVGLDGRSDTYADKTGFVAGAHAHFDLTDLGTFAKDAVSYTIDSNKRLVEITPAN